MAACHIGIGYDARGPNNTIVQGEASSLLALVECVSVIQRGQADVMLTGGTGSRLNITPMLYRGDSNLSHRGDDPAGASRPYDRDRDGMVNGEGAAAFVLESRAHAESRGAEVLCRIPGHARSFEAPANGRPRPGSARERVIQLALGQSQIDVTDVGHVNAEGISTIEDDAAEAAVIARVLGQTPVTAPKSYFGNLGGGTGAVEMVASILGLVEGQIPPTLNYSVPDPSCPINVVHGQPQTTDRGTALVLSRSSTGQVVAVVLRRP
jgi:3-oxoacyl-[acyl-carrier-protein] synthase II